MDGEDLEGNGPPAGPKQSDMSLQIPVGPMATAVRMKRMNSGRLHVNHSTIEEMECHELVEQEPRWQQLLGTREFVRAHLWRDVMVELFGTTAFFIVSIGAVLSTFGQAPGPDSPPRVDPPALGIGLIHFVLLGFAIIATRGGHMNPLITFFTMLLGLTKPLRALAYIAAQAVGASLASLLMKAALPRETQQWTMNEKGQGELGGCAAGSQIDATQLFLIEFGCSLFLLLVAYGVAFDEHKALAAGPIVGPLIISATLGGLIYASGTLVPTGFSGAVMNPARCFGPSFAMGGDNWDNWWVYWLGPFSAAAVSAVAFWIINTPKLEDYAHEFVHAVEHIHHHKHL